MRRQRRSDLLRILHEGTASSQQDIVGALRAAGHDVTQATVSRDLREVGATKARIGDRFVYRLPDEIPRSQGGDLLARSLARTLDEFVLSVVQAHSLVVLATAPGHAAAVARAIDFAGVEEVVGTVAGDDTIFVAASDPQCAAALSERWSVQGRAAGNDQEVS